MLEAPANGRQNQLPSQQQQRQVKPFKLNAGEQQQKITQADDSPIKETTKALGQKPLQELDDDQPFKYRVGYWWSEKKAQKLNASELTSLFAQCQCQLVKIDLERPIDEQGPFSLIVHKVSDFLVKADQGDNAAKKIISAFESYARKHPETVILDPLDNNRALLDRYKQYRLIEQSGLAKEGVVFTPPFVHLTSTNMDANRGRIRRSKITFPIVCKPILAQGSTGAHQMCIIFSEAGLKDVKPPCVAQSFVNHNAKLFKLFVIKDRYYVMERPSLKNFQAGEYETVFFYSHDISKPNSSSSLTELDESDKINLENMMTRMRLDLQKTPRDNQNIISDPTACHENKNQNNIINNKLRHRYDHEGGSKGQTPKYGLSTLTSYPRESITSFATPLALSQITDDVRKQPNETYHCSPLMPNDDKLSRIVNIFSEKLGLTFYGIDIIIENGTSRYAIIDMNTFPGYDGVENFLTIFRDVVCDAIPKNINETPLEQLCRNANRRKPLEIDSGIEST